MSANVLFQTNLGPKADTAAPSQAVTTQPGSAPAPAAQSAAPSWMNSMLPVLLPLLVLMFFLSTRKNDKREQAARAGMKKGDRVMSESGLLGELMEMGDKTSKVKLAPGITVEMMTNKIVPVVAAAPAKDDKLKDLKDAKSSVPGTVTATPAAEKK